MNSDKASSSLATHTESCYRDICILIVDFDLICLSVASGMLRALTYEVLMAHRAMEALEMIRDEDLGIDMVLMELHMPDMCGLDLLDEIKRISDLPVLVMSFDRSENAMLSSLEKGAYFYFTKPLYMEDMSDIWQYVHTRRHQQQRQRQRLEAEKKEVAALQESSFNEEEEMHEHEGSFVSDWNNSYGDDQSTEKTTKDPVEEDTLTSPLRKKARLEDVKSPNSDTVGDGSSLFPIPIEEEQLISPSSPQPSATLPPPSLTPPQGKRMLERDSEAEPKDDHEAGSNVAAKGGDTN